MKFSFTKCVNDASNYKNYVNLSLLTIANFAVHYIFCFLIWKAYQKILNYETQC